MNCMSLIPPNVEPKQWAQVYGKSGSSQTDAGDVNMPCSGVFPYCEHCLNLWYASGTFKLSSEM